MKFVNGNKTILVILIIFKYEILFVKILKFNFLKEAYAKRIELLIDAFQISEFAKSHQVIEAKSSSFFSLPRIIYLYYTFHFFLMK